MCTAVCTFGGEYFRYGGLNADFKDTDSVCLSIGSYESAFLADLVINFILEKVDECWSEEFDDYGELRFIGSFRDDGFLVCDGREFQDAKGWLGRFQALVNRIFAEKGVKNTLKFTVDEWSGEHFEFLDAPLGWDEEGHLTCSGFKKMNQEIEYLHSESLHSPGSVKGIKKSVEKRLGRLFVRHDNAKLDEKFDQVYPEHAAKLVKAGLCVASDFRSIREIKADDDLEFHQTKKKPIKKRNVYFCIKYSKIN